MLISPLEVLYFLVLTVATGFIFMQSVVRPRTEFDAEPHYGFDWSAFKLAVMAAAPAVVIHELFHKFVALGFGLSASFEIWGFGLFLGIILKLIGSPFILFAPGYVAISGISSPIQSFFISFAGPFANLLLFIIAWYLLEHARRLTRTQATVLYLTKQINLFLFIFNMLPIPPLDGFQVFTSLFRILF
ncbi:MAG: M50 family metallopeptidase [Nanoarchaeota archaeon]|nr:M50 family metallopeptidase [Nanoarchaeota archaeon]